MPNTTKRHQSTADMYDRDFDGQKLMYHPLEVAGWLALGHTRGPLYTEMELTNRCNCKCIFCGVDHLVGQTGDVMGPELAAKIISGLAELGNKSIMFCGNGEPLLNRHVVEIVRLAARTMSVSMTTNGIALSREKLPLLDDLEWLRFSVNGYDPASYAAIHGAPPSFFPQVMTNIAGAVARKRRFQLPVTIGAQLVLLPENAGGAPDLARQFREVGVDYFSVKPYSRHPFSRNRLEIDYSRYLDLEEKLRAFEDENFKIIFRKSSMIRAGSGKTYEKCFGTHFISFVSANGDIWECNVFAGDKRFLIGNGGEESMEEIWTGERRRQVVLFIKNELSLAECRDLCRMDACNTYLWRLKNPRPHDNFI